MHNNAITNFLYRAEIIKEKQSLSGTDFREKINQYKGWIKKKNFPIHILITDNKLYTF